MVSSSSSLKHAILALAAFDYPQLNGMNGFNSVALHHKSLSLQLLQQNIRKLLISCGGADAADVMAVNSSISADFQEIALTTLIMCIAEITTGSTKEWATHLHGASAIFKAVGRNALDNRLVQFCTQYFFIRDVFSSTAALDTESYFSEKTASVQWADLLESLTLPEDRVGSKISLHVGCSGTLVSIISSITALAREKHKCRQTLGASIEREQEFLAEANALQYRLDQLQEECIVSPDGSIMVVGESDGDQTFSAWDQENQRHRVMFYSLLFTRAAQLYLRHAGFGIPVNHASIQQESLPALLNLLDLLKVQEREVYPMWPLFIASCMAVSEKDRRMVLNQFQRLRRVWTLGNIGVTERSIHWVWKWHDITLDGHRAAAKSTMEHEVNSTTSAASNVDWDAPLRRLGWRISLT